MTKLKSHATWNKLTPEQRQKLDHWMFDLNLSHRETHQRAQTELGLVCSLSTIRRMFAHGVKLRAVREVAESQGLSDELAGSGGKLENLRHSSLMLIASRLLQKMATQPDLKEISVLGRLMMQSEEREIQRVRMELVRERFQFNASKAALKILPLLDEMNQEEYERETARVEDIKRRIFGKALDGVVERTPANNGGVIPKG